MSVALAVSFRDNILPWAPSLDDDARFRRVLHRVLALVVVLCLIMLFMPAPQADRKELQEPPRLAKLLLEKEIPKPVPPPPAPKVAEKAPEKVVPQQVPNTKPDAKPPRPLIKGAEVPEARNPQPNKPPGEVGEARKRASGVGLLAMKDQLAEIHGAPVAVQLNQNIKQGPGVGTGVGVGVGAGNEAGIPQRNMITSNATGGSGGVKTAAPNPHTRGGGARGRAAHPRPGV